MRERGPRRTRRASVGETAARLTALAALTLGSAWPLAAARAAPVAVGQLVDRAGDPLEASYDDAFRAGARESGSAGPPPASEGRTEGAAALARGEEEYLKARLRAAEKLLAQAVDAYLATPADLDAEPASRALLLLAEAQLALGRAAAAEKTLERGLTTVPDFPGLGVAPAPEVAEQLHRIAARTAPRLTGVLEVQSDVAGVTVWLSGRRLGPAPLRRTGLPPVPLLLRLERAGDAPSSRVVDLAQGPATVRWASSEARRTAMGTAAARGDAQGLFAVGADLEAAEGATTSCVGLLEDETHALVARFSGARARFLGGHWAPAPDTPGGWRVLGRFCQDRAAGNLDAAAIARRLQGPRTRTPATPGGGGARSAVGWTLVGLGAAGLGAGGYFGWNALEAEDRYDAARTRPAADRAADDARASALHSDVAFGAGAALVIGGALLLLLPAEPPPP